MLLLYCRYMYMLRTNGKMHLAETDHEDFSRQALVNMVMHH